MKRIHPCLIALFAAALIACGGKEEAKTPTGGTIEKPAMPADTGDKADAAAEQAGDAASETTPEEAPAAPTVESQALELLDRAGKAVAGESWDEAKGYLKQLQDMKSQLSPELQKKVDDLATQLAAKAGLSGSGIKIPGGG